MKALCLLERQGGEGGPVYEPGPRGAGSDLSELSPMLDRSSSLSASPGICSCKYSKISSCRRGIVWTAYPDR